MLDNVITVIVRTASIDRLQLLDQALFSLWIQTWPHVEVLVMMQSPDEDFRRGVNNLLAKFAWPQPQMVRSIAVDVPAGVDGRTRLLNVGLEQASGRYVAFLDDDDVMFEDAYRTLIEELRRDARAALALGDCRICHLTTDGDQPYVTKKIAGFFRGGRKKTDLLIDNFIPIHSYVLDRDRIEPSALHFVDDAIPLEDFDFLLRLARGHVFNLTRETFLVCEYRLHEGNSIWINGQSLPSPKLTKARRYIQDTYYEITLNREEYTNSPPPSRGHHPAFPLLVRKAFALDTWIKSSPRTFGVLLKAYRRFYRL